jgi:tetratricopeptide (TPR) repeat protein
MAVTTLGKRYILKDEIGRGGMGTVYRTHDRLSGDHIALKRVTDTSALGFQDRPDTDSELHLALANEFKVLASLRHPNIIAVLDYGFDRDNLPYFTMPFVDDAQDIIVASQTASPKTKLKLFMQMLQASVYLHRRNVLHRDLKPANVLVRQDHVMVMDFGLSMRTVDTSQNNNPDDMIAGTLSYLAPEVLKGEPPTRSADLYAIGLIAYEMFAGEFPYDQTTATTLITDILSKTPDFSVLDLNTEIINILEKLLAKNQEDRYPEAIDVIQDLTDALDMPPAPETTAIRESFLQAAELVGRETELALLRQNLDKSSDSQGSTWIIGGESGVGKTRLVDEIRTRALVNGVLVLRGQAVNTGGRIYQIWHDILRDLTLYADATDAEASILKTIDSSLVDVLDHDIVDLEALDPQETQNHLFESVASMLKRLDQPLMIILEDMQWAGKESLVLLRYLNKNLISNASIFVLGNYRDDERPNLSKELPNVNFLKLERLQRNAIADLSASMLGNEVGRRETIVQLLERETEGNVFFIVEVVRALAENAGQLEAIGQMTLPQNVFAEGVKTVIQQRLAHVPSEHLPLLKLVAVAGRYIDYNLIKRLADGFNTNVDMWLNGGADVAILEVVGGRWQFTHDKLRERILSDLTDEERPHLHQQVAEMIEALYPMDTTTYQQLDYLWRVAGNHHKETFYAAASGEIELQSNSNEAAARYFRRAMGCLEYLPDYPDKLRRELILQIQLSVALTASLGYSAWEVEESYQVAHQLSLEIGELPYIFRALYGLTSSHSSRGYLNKAEKYADNLLQLASQMSLEFKLMAHNIMSSINLRQGKTTKSLTHFQFVSTHYDRETHHHLGIQYGQDPGLSCWSFGALAWMQIGEINRAKKWADRALQLADDLGYPFARLFALYYGGVIPRQVVRDWEENINFASEALDIAKQYNYPFFQSMAMMSLAMAKGMVAENETQMQASIAQFYEGLDLWESLGAPRNNPNWLGLVAELHIVAHEYDTGLTLINQAIELSQSSGEGFITAEYYRLKAIILIDIGASGDDIQTAVEKGITLARELKSTLIEFRTALTYAHYLVKQGHYQKAHQLLQPIYDSFIDKTGYPDVQEAEQLMANIGQHLGII